MQIDLVNSYDEMSWKAKDLLVDFLQENPHLLICAATGNSPSGTYQLLADEFKDRPGLFSKLRVIKLDEWGGVPLTWPGTCEAYLQEHLIRPLEIEGTRTISFDSDPVDPAAACKAVGDRLKKEGPIDVCILGLGRNGHLGFNEPAHFLQADCHVAKLSPTSLQHQMIKEMPEKPTFGLTLGMGDLLASKKILLLISGQGKDRTVDQFLTKEITTQLPASFLWLHPHVTCLIDRESVKCEL